MTPTYINGTHMIFSILGGLILERISGLDIRQKNIL